MQFKKKYLTGWNLILLVCFGFFALFFLYPISQIVIGSFTDSATGEFSLGAYQTFFSRRYYTNTVWNSLRVTLAATLSTAIFGSLLAYINAVIHIRGRTFLQVAMIVSVLSPPFIGAYSWIVLLGRAGIITRAINSLFGIQYGGIFGFSGILLVFTVRLSPLIFLYVSGAMKNMDTSLIEAAESLGCHGLRKIRLIIVPLILPTLLSAGLLVFMRSLADFGTPMLIGEGYRTLPVLIFSSFMGEVTRDYSLASAIAVLVTVVTTLIFLVQKFIASRRNIAMNALHPIEPKKIRGWKNVLAHMYAYAFVTIAMLPTVVVLINSFQRTTGTIFVPGFSLDSYRTAFSAMATPIMNTYRFSFAALGVILVIGIAVSYATVRRPNVISSVLDTTTMFPYIIPGSVLGIAMLTTFNTRPILLSGTATILIASFVIRRLPYTIRSSSAILRQMNPRVEEAAQSLGASPPKTFTRVTLPIMFSGVMPGAIMSWMSIMSELSASIMLFVPSTATMTIAIYTQVMRGNFGVASALASILIVSTVIALFVFFKITGRRELSL